MQKLSSKRDNRKRLLYLSVEVNDYLVEESIRQQKSVGLLLDTLVREKMNDTTRYEILSEKVQNFIAEIEGGL